jgi:hypothetical protein
MDSADKPKARAKTIKTQHSRFIIDPSPFQEKGESHLPSPFNVSFLITRLTEPCECYFSLHGIMYHLLVRGIVLRIVGQGWWRSRSFAFGR